MQKDEVHSEAHGRDELRGLEAKPAKLVVPWLLLWEVIYQVIQWLRRDNVKRGQLNHNLAQKEGV